MQFFVDEAGSFAPALGGPGSWYVTAAFVVAEHQADRAFATLDEFKQAAGTEHRLVSSVIGYFQTDGAADSPAAHLLDKKA